MKLNKEDLVDNFLIIPDEFSKYVNDDNLIWVYKIINITNNKVYIGKTKKLRQRALNYISAYLKGDMDTNIFKAINTYGIRSFIMTPLEFALKGSSASIKEKYYIDKYDSIENGYNKCLGSADYDKREGSSVSTPQTLFSKFIKSKFVAAISPAENEIIFSTGLKLFGLVIGRSKDEIKSSAKRETKLDGYFIYYLNTEDFESQIDSAENKILKNRFFRDNKLQYHDFIIYANKLISILNTDHESDMQLKFITQSNSDKGYEFRKIEEFFELYSDMKKDNDKYI